MSKLDRALYEKLDNLLNSMGYELVGGEMVPQGRQLTCRLYVDSATGVTLDDCSKISHQVSAMFDVEDPIQGHYRLEVSSPGIDRPLFLLKHYQRFIGSKVKIKLHSPIEQRRQFKGTLLRVEGETIHILADDLGYEVKLPYDAIEKANLIGEINP